MENPTVDGLTREEWAAQMRLDGVPEQQIEHELAIAFGEVPGDAINITDRPDLAGDGEDE